MAIGRIRNPQCSPYEALRMPLAASMAETHRVGFGGPPRGLGTLGIKGSEVTGDVIEGIGGVLKRLFGGPKEEEPTR